MQNYEFWDFLAPILADNGECRGCVAQNLRTMEILAFASDALVIASGGCGLIYGRSTMPMALHGECRQSLFSGGGGLYQRRIHPSAPDGDSWR